MTVGFNPDYSYIIIDGLDEKKMVEWLNNNYKGGKFGSTGNAHVCVGWVLSALKRGHTGFDPGGRIDSLKPDTAHNNLIELFNSITEDDGSISVLYGPGKDFSHIYAPYGWTDDRY